MSEGAVGFLVLLGLTAGAAVLWHALVVTSYLLASVGAALSAVVAFQVFDYVHLFPTGDSAEAMSHL